jgi:uncharacterized protein
MSYDKTTLSIAFAGNRLLASGALEDVAAAVKRAADQDGSRMALVFDAVTSKPIDLDLRGTIAEVCGRLPAAAPPESRSPGRPKLGVVAREVTLLPRHWDWLSGQPGGASVALRKLVDAARKAASPATDLRAGCDSLYRFMAATAGDFPGFEEALRALFAGDRHRFSSLIGPWPADIQTHIKTLSRAAFGAETADD